MSTNAIIAIKNFTDGVIKFTTLNWDGYLDGAGKILLDHYQSPGKIHSLINEGQISSLGKDIGIKNDFDNRNKDICCFYHRDRNEDKRGPWSYNNIKGFIEEESGNYSYIYCYIDNDWFYLDQSIKEFVPLKPILEKHNIIEEKDAVIEELITMGFVYDSENDVYQYKLAERMINDSDEINNLNQIGFIPYEHENILAAAAEYIWKISAELHNEFRHEASKKFIKDIFGFRVE